ncbi:PHB depolymerase family esterase [Roseomonas sp. CAU 1739]|uniref:alpha/beta hydrolase family esterase n=1 Tax=Roseomonas sp. CAU 1739 TaxID=3140364 RepID=UPI00325A78D1
MPKPRHSLTWLLLLLPLLAGAAGPARACGPDTDCLVGSRSYRIRLPPLPPDGARVGAILLAHGYRDTAANIMADADIAAAVSALGLALIAPQSDGPRWNLPGQPGGPRPGIDEMAAMDRLVADVIARFPVNPARIMASGFSAGGMLAWNLACRRADLFAGFAPLSGTFWNPLPEDCPSGPATVLHTHGTEDPTVPLHGRAIRDTSQGDVFEVIRRYATWGGFGAPVERRAEGPDCSRRTNPAGRVLQLCLRPGGHDLRAIDLVRAWRDLAAIQGW